MSDYINRVQEALNDVPDRMLEKHYLALVGKIHSEATAKLHTIQQLQILQNGQFGATHNKRARKSKDITVRISEARTQYIELKALYDFVNSQLGIKPTQE